MTYQYDVRLSKRLSWLLRHGVESRGLKLRPDGFLELEKVLKLKDFASYTSEDIEHVVEWNNKKRFGVVRERGRITLIRAVQGHSVHVDEEQLLTKIDQADAVPMCIHGTY
ncbi:MAG: uncharacterized protein KVP18_004372 [Porospora cf. gigantea A]|nr:MAG: hypothetical protein KVP18_004372 [Porospora cf. gigantea A]